MIHVFWLGPHTDRSWLLQLSFLHIATVSSVSMRLVISGAMQERLANLTQPSGPHPHNSASLGLGAPLRHRSPGRAAGGGACARVLGLPRDPSLPTERILAPLVPWALHGTCCAGSPRPAGRPPPHTPSRRPPWVTKWPAAGCACGASARLKPNVRGGSPAVAQRVCSCLLPSRLHGC